jgi:hypothetical protein
VILIQTTQGRELRSPPSLNVRAPVGVTQTVEGCCCCCASARRWASCSRNNRSSSRIAADVLAAAASRVALRRACAALRSACSAASTRFRCTALRSATRLYCVARAAPMQAISAVRRCEMAAVEPRRFGQRGDLATSACGGHSAGARLLGSGRVGAAVAGGSPSSTPVERCSSGIVCDAAADAAADEGPSSTGVSGGDRGLIGLPQPSTARMFTLTSCRAWTPKWPALDRGSSLSRRRRGRWPPCSRGCEAQLSMNGPFLARLYEGCEYKVTARVRRRRHRGVGRPWCFAARATAPLSPHSSGLLQRDCDKRMTFAIIGLRYRLAFRSIDLGGLPLLPVPLPQHDAEEGRSKANPGWRASARGGTAGRARSCSTRHTAVARR